MEKNGINVTQSSTKLLVHFLTIFIPLIDFIVRTDFYYV